MNTTDRENRNSRCILLILTAFSAAFIIASFFAGNPRDLIPGFIRINTSPSQFTRDYFNLGGVGGSFLNAGLIGFVCCGLLFFTGAKCTGLTFAAYWLNVGFGTFGMTLLTIWPFYLGTFIYSRVKKVSFGSVANMAMFSSALAPFAGELLLRYPLLESRGITIHGLLAAAALGIVTGLWMPSLCAFSLNFHKGYDLYNAGPAAGFLGFLVYCMLFRSPGIEVPGNTDIGNGARGFVNVFFLILFGLCLAAALLSDRECLKSYRLLLHSDSYKTDFIEKFGLSVSLLTMGIYGLFILLYYNIVPGITIADGSLAVTGAKFTGATMGAIMCMFAFSCYGSHPRNVYPVMIGYGIASLVPLAACYFGLTEAPNWNLTSQAILVGVCFASGLAPISGHFGFWPGVAAGAIHATLVMSVPLLHGGFCLYNGGFTAGIVAFLLVPLLEWYWGEKT